MSARKFEGRVVLAALLAVFAALLAGCSSVPRSVLAPEVSLTRLSVVDASAPERLFRVTLQIRNPNAILLPIESLSFSARLASQGILMGDSSEAVSLPPQGIQTIDVEVRTDLVSSVASLLAVAQGPENEIAYELNGQLSVGGRPPRQLPFSYSGQVPLTATMRRR